MIDEAALPREVGSAGLMRAQAQHIAQIAQQPNVTVQVLPFSAGAHRGMRDAFTALRFPEEPMNTVYLELDGAALYLESPSEVQRYAATFTRLTKLALEPDATIDCSPKCKEKERAL